MDNMDKKKNPSRKFCESTIRRILMTEVLEKGTNQRFKTAADFMPFFESLYPASDSLTKQVQRAVKALAMPKDHNGYFIINKTQEQLDQESELSFVLQKCNASILPLDAYETVFLKVDSKYKSYLYQLLTESTTFSDKYITILDTSNGLLFYTTNSNQLKVLLDSLIKKSIKNQTNSTT